MGLHTGEPRSGEGGYVGLDVHRAARICAAGHGGQILVSQTSRDLVDERPAARRLAQSTSASTGSRTSIEAQRIYQVAARGPAGRRSRRCARSSGRPNNLPRELTSFVGRDAELEAAERGR